jgi:hypothetical protein
MEMMITCGGVTCVNIILVVLVIAAAGIARVVAQCLDEELVIVDAEGINDVREGAFGGGGRRRHGRSRQVVLFWIFCFMQSFKRGIRHCCDSHICIFDQASSQKPALSSRCEPCCCRFLLVHILPCSWRMRAISGVLESS